MIQYKELIATIFQYGEKREDRTGVGVIGYFGYQMRFDLSRGFPLLSLKYTPFKAVMHELLWFLSGSDNIKYLNDNGVHIWDKWADSDGNVGRIYGVQWRRWKGGDGNEHDQIAELIKGIKENPYSRRHVVSAWNVADLGEMALPPCHAFFQFYVSNDGRLSCLLTQRSADVFIGVPFNIASYALLTHMIAHVCGLKVGELICTFGDAHIYSNHVYHAKSLLTLKPYPLPTLELDSTVTDIDGFKPEHIKLSNYQSHPKINVEVAV